MFFSYDENLSIHVPFPFSRIMTPFMTTDTADGKIDFSVHMTEWESGAQVDEHMHTDSTEAMYCLSGSGSASVGENMYDLKPNTMITALPGQLHWIKNTGTETLKVLCIFSPAISAAGLRERAENAVKEYQKNKKNQDICK